MPPVIGTQKHRVHLRLLQSQRFNLLRYINRGPAVVALVYKFHLGKFFGDQRHVSLSNPMIRLIQDRKSTRLNSSHVRISYAVFCLKKKKKKTTKNQKNKKQKL